ncbi:proline dehydrogenase family protein [Arthrobacter sp. CJ23]|uniref:proline dehydrogenase family protein n=1 Tax=Arthrobacter sp. CJ23 TaxID=2972479 RepID=UPI00215CF9E4|nr:proline dehydrogenase family protein [Arthrobacter sp. CJ23]UVJ40366.1 proline dehydrogenase family protein [Arthrobacter sp. CJ23]
MTGTPTRQAAADVLRAWALDENLKKLVMGSPSMASLAAHVAKRYSGGESIEDVLDSARASMARGHAVSIEYAGESVRDAEVANAETDIFLRLIAELAQSGMACTVSADLSHIGAVVDREQGLRNARRIISALEPLGMTFMISAEGSDRTDLVLGIYEELANAHDNVGITIQARLHRTSADLDRVLALPGPIRLVKGAFLEPEDIAYPRGSVELQEAYLEMARTLIESGHRAAIATHDAELLDKLFTAVPAIYHAGHIEFEMLLGLGTETLDRLHSEGFATREYSIFGGEWWLYVLNRIAEQPDRVFDAIVDLGSWRQSPPDDGV